MKSPGVLAFVMAGGDGTRLHPLTGTVAKPGLAFGTDHRLIDFVLSNLYNSQIRAVYVLLQYRPGILLEHITRTWKRSADATREFVTPVLPASTPDRAAFLGTAHAVHQCLHLVERHAPELVAVFAADHVYRMDVRQMARFHLENRADATVAALPVPVEQASSFGIIEADSRNRIRGFEEKPLHPVSLPHRPGAAYASMGNYLFARDVLLHTLRGAIERGETDFGRGILPRMIRHGRVFAYDFSKNMVPGLHAHEEPAYWRDVGTLAAYVAAHRDLLGARPKFSLKNEKWPIYGSELRTAESNMDKRKVRNSICAGGTVARNARLCNTIVQRGAHVDDGAELEDCIVMEGARIGARTRLHRAIVMGPNSITEGVSRDCELLAGPGRRLASDGTMIVPPLTCC